MFHGNNANKIAGERIICVKLPQKIQLNERESHVIAHLNVYILKNKFLFHAVIFNIRDQKAASLIVSLLHLEN